MNTTSKWLRQVAEEIRREQHNGWGNTVEQAADDYDALAARLAEAEALLREIYQRDRHFDSGAWLIRMYHDDYARIHALTNPDSADGGEK